MLPIRLATTGLARRSSCLVLLLFLGCVLVGPMEGGPLRGRDLGEFRSLIEPPRALNAPLRTINSLDVAGVAAYFERLYEASKDQKYLPSRGDVAEVLLFTEWDSEGFSIDSRVLLKPIKDAVLKAMASGNYQGFQEDIRKLMGDQDAVGNPEGFRRTLLGEIKRQVRLDLLDRLENGLRSSLSKTRNEITRISGANVISRIMTTLRREDFAKSIVVDTDNRGAATSVRDLPQRLRDLSPELREMLRESNPQVQVAGVRALSELGLSAPQLAEAYRPLLSSSQMDVVVRRETADALLHVLDVMTQVAEQRSTRNRGAGTKENPLSPFRETVTQLETVQQLLPVAALGLEDDDAEVRGRSLRACNRSAMLVDDLARHLSRDLTSDLANDLSSQLDLSLRQADELLEKFRKRLVDSFLSTLAAVDRALPKLNARARDSVPNLRVLACHVVETFALTSQRVREASRIGLTPAPRPEPTLPPEDALPLDDKKPRGGVQLPSRRNGNGRKASAARPSQWAVARLERPTALPNLLPLPSAASAPAVTLERPVQLPSTSAPRSTQRVSAAGTTSGASTRKSEARPGTVQLTSLLAQKIENLPSPTPVSSPWPQTVEIMITNLCDPDYRVRLGAVDTLETLEDVAEPAVPALVQALRDSNKFVRWSSARTLGRFASRRNDKSDPFYEKNADRVVTGLVGLLNDREDPSVRITAAYALEQYGETARKAVPHLARVINRGDKDYILAILHTIQGIGTDAAPALPNVAWLLGDTTQPTSVRVEAAKTLGLFGELAKEQPRVLPVLRDVMLGDANSEVRNAASTAVLAIENPRKK